MCSVAAHERSRVAWDQLVGDNELAVVFSRGSSGTEDDVLSVFMSPVLPGSQLSQDAFDELELSPRTLLSWQAIFQGLLEQDADKVSDPKVKTVLFSETQREVKFGYTPRKREASSDEMNEWTVRAKAKLAPVDKDLGDKPSPAVTRLLNGGQWSSLVTNVETIQGNLIRLGQGTKQRLDDVDEGWNQLEYKVSLLKALVGDRPDVMGTSMVFDILSMIIQDASSSKRSAAPAGLTAQDASRLAALEQALSHLTQSWPSALKAEIDKEIQSKLFAPGTPFQANFARPILQFLQNWSTHPSSPGNKLEDAMGRTDHRLKALKGVTPSLAAQIQNLGNPLTKGSGVGGGAIPNPFAWSATAFAHPAPPPAQSVGAISSGVDLVALEESVRRLRDDVSAIRDQLESEAVEIASETFKSKSECGVWLATQHAEDLVYLFVDAISFLSLSTCDAHDNEQEAANSRATSVKVRDSNTYQTAFIASYSLEVPPLLGKGANADVTRASRTLAAVPTFQDFYPGGGKEGVRDRLLYYIKDGSKTLTALLMDTLNRSSPAFAVARAMLSSSFAFWEDFCRWMVNYHNELLGKNNASTGEVWTLIAHCARAVFKSIRSARACGHAFHSPEGIFWGSLQAHRVMQEFKSAEFSGHPEIALILHKHLINFSTPLSEFEEFEGRHRREMTELHDKIEKAQRSANQANSTANNNKRGPAGAAAQGGGGSPKN